MKNREKLSMQYTETRYWTNLNYSKLEHRANARSVYAVKLIMAIGNINSRTVESKAVATTFSGRGVWSPSCPSFPSFSLSYLFPFIIFPFASLSLPREAAQVNSARDLHAALQVPPPVFGTKRAENEMHFFLYFESKKRVWCLQMLFYFCWPKSDSWSKCFFLFSPWQLFIFFGLDRLLRWPLPRRKTWHLYSIPV